MSLCHRCYSANVGQDLNLCGCSKVSVDGVSDMINDRQEVLENDGNTGLVSQSAMRCDGNAAFAVDPEERYCVPLQTL